MIGYKIGESFPVYTYGEIIWHKEAPVLSYYVYWTPSSGLSGTFTMHGSTYNFSDYSGSYSSSMDYVTSSAFMSTGVLTVSTNTTKMEEYAFCSCTSLSGAYLQYCDYVGSSAFYGCISLSSIVFYNCTYIGSNAFEACDLSKVSIPSCSYVGSRAFYGCDFKSISVPVCEYIGAEAFKSCSLMSIITVKGSSVCTLEASNAFEGTKITSTTGTIYVPQSLLSDYEVAPEWSYFFQRMQPISYSSSYYFKWLPSEISGTFSIHFVTYNFEDYPDGYFEDFDGALVNYSGVIDDSVFSRPSFTYFETNAFIAYSALLNECSMLSQVVCTNITHVGVRYCWSCPNLVSVSLPECTYINWLAFESCVNLKDVYIPKCSYIDSGVFRGCIGLSYIELPLCSSISQSCFSDCINLQSISAPVLNVVGTSAFYNCYNLTSVYLPSCTHVRSYAFENCFNLSVVSLPACTGIGSCAFKNCSLTSIDLPECISIETSAFENCSLNSVILPKLSLLNSGVLDNTHIEFINIEGCGTVGSSALYNCTSLSSVILSSCTAIYEYAFGNCVKLSNIELTCSTSMGYIGKFAFYNCYSLSTITLGFNRVVSLNMMDYNYNNIDPFYGTYLRMYSDGSIYVPASLVSAYKSATNWSLWSDLIYPINN